jgi:CheY-like chemotaxis protein
MDIIRPVILLIENDPGDVFLFRRALAKQNFAGTVRVVATVQGAMRYLTNRGDFTDREYYPRPDLIVSDMNLGGHFGTELLEWLREQPALAEIPFVFLSGSWMPPDKARAKELGADAFYDKTGDIQVAAEHAAGMLQLLGSSSVD